MSRTRRPAAFPAPRCPHPRAAAPPTQPRTPACSPSALANTNRGQDGLTRSIVAHSHAIQLVACHTLSHCELHLALSRTWPGRPRAEHDIARQALHAEGCRKPGGHLQPGEGGSGVAASEGAQPNLQEERRLGCRWVLRRLLLHCGFPCRLADGCGVHYQHYLWACSRHTTQAASQDAHTHSKPCARQQTTVMGASCDMLASHHQRQIVTQTVQQQGQASEALSSPNVYCSSNCHNACECTLGHWLHESPSTSACGAALPPDVSLWSRLCTTMYLSTVSAAQSGASGCWLAQPNAHAETAAAAAASAGCMFMRSQCAKTASVPHVTTLHLSVVRQRLAVGSTYWAVAEGRNAVAAEAMPAHRGDRL